MMNPILQVERLYKRFGTLEVIRGISFDIYANEVVGLAGLSGSGKSVIAKLLAGNGADIIMHAANQTGLGVIRGAEEAGVKAIGVDEWQGKINEDVVFWSALKDIAGAVYKAGESVLDDTFEPGLQRYDVGTGIQMYDERDFNKLSPELQAAVEQLKEDIMNGVVVVPVPVQ